MPLSKEQIVELLGSQRTSPLIWKKVRGFDCSFYYGSSSNGADMVVIYLGGFPGFQFDSSLPTVDGKLGMYSVKWQKKVKPDHTLRFETVFSLHSDYWKAYVFIQASQETDITRLIEEVSKLVMFNHMPEPVGAP